MKERPILFSAPMVRAILEGRKTQTRRVLKVQPVVRPDLSPSGLLAWMLSVGSYVFGNKPMPEFVKRCPYGHPGDRMWVREAFRTEESYDHIKPSDIPVASAGHTLAVPFWYAADLSGADFQHMPPGLRPGKYRPGMFMPRAASRILLEITAVRVERLWDISEADAMAEGIYSKVSGGIATLSTDQREHILLGLPGEHRMVYRELWESINGTGSWKSNPWVWVVEFKRVEGGAE